MLLAHGGGGRLMHNLIDQLFAPTFDQLESQHDGAVWLLGGVEDMQRFVDDVWRAPIDAEGGLGEWTAIEPGLPAARGHVHVTPVVRGRIYSLGGRITTADGRPGVTGDVRIGSFD